MKYIGRMHVQNLYSLILTVIPMEGSSLLGFFQLKVMVLPVIDSITGVPSGGSGRISENDNIGIRGPVPYIFF